MSAMVITTDNHIITRNEYYIGHGGKDGVRSAKYGVRSPSFIRLKVELS